jgi:hypothetical protein
VRFLDILDQALPFAQSTKVLEFLDMVLDPIWEKAREDYGFEHYDTYLRLLLDVLERMRVESYSPTLLVYLAEALDRVGDYISSRSREIGAAWEASRTWKAEHSRLTPELRRELHSLANAHLLFGLTRMLDMVESGVEAT